MSLLVFGCSKIARGFAASCFFSFLPLEPLSLGLPSSDPFFFFFEIRGGRPMPFDLVGFPPEATCPPDVNDGAALLASTQSETATLYPLLVGLPFEVSWIPCWRSPCFSFFCKSFYPDLTLGSSLRFPSGRLFFFFQLFSFLGCSSLTR